MDFPKDTTDKLVLALGAFTMAKFLLDALTCMCTRKSKKYEVLLAEIGELKAQNERIIAGLYTEASTPYEYVSELEEQEQEQEPGEEAPPPPTTAPVELELEQEQEPASQAEANTIVDELSHSAKVEEKHKRLVQRLTPGQLVYVSYKKTTFPATFRLLSSAPHGYVFEAGTESFLTPSQFSFKRKHALNPEVSSDNGWDTVYIVTGQNAKNKDIKKSLNELIA